MKNLSGQMSLKGRKALITGAAGHLGHTFAKALADAGVAVALVDLDQNKCDEAAEELADTYAVATVGLACDLADLQQTRTLPEQAAVALKGLDILINCAAFVGTSDLEGWAVPIEEQSPEAWCAALNVNLTAPFVLTQAAAPLLKKSKHGSVIMIGSIYGLLGPDMRLYEGTAMGNPAAYGASKAGLIGLTKYLATVLAPEIRVNAVSVGGVHRGQPDSFVSRYVAKTPLNRMAREEDVVGAVLFLSSEMSSYVTGANLLVDGGFCAW